jgi:hypothetical protein
MANPWLELPIVRNLQVPGPEPLAQQRLVGAADDDVDVAVVARLAADEEIDRPATDDPPRRWKAPQQLDGLVEAERVSIDSRSLVRVPPQPLDPRAATLFFKSPFDRRLRRFGRPALARHSQRLAQLRDEPLECQLAVPRLAPLVLRDCAQYRSGAVDDPPLLRVSQRLGALDLEHGLDARFRLLCVLPARPART